MPNLLTNKQIRLLITGGTFDKEYDMITGKLYFKKTHLPEILDLGRCTLDYEIEDLMLIDSLEMDDEKRALISDRCRSCGEHNLVITHGTDTMTETAAFLAKQDLKKTIVLTGAMIPYKFGASDALFNLGSALAYSQALPDGVYISMNGKCFNWDGVKKNRETGYFDAV